MSSKWIPAPVNTFRVLKTETKWQRIATVLLLVLAISACAVLPPTQELSDARQMLKVAQTQPQNAQVTAFYLWMAENHLLSAQHELEKGHHAYSYARFHALEAYRAATRAHQLARIFEQTRTTLIQIKDLGYFCPEGESLLQQAYEAGFAHQFEHALTLAQQAQDHAQAALNNYLGK
jgi:hypothetical protein